MSNSSRINQSKKDTYYNISKIVDILACPDCGSSLEVKKDLVCTSCNRAFKIEDGIPIILPSSMEKIKESIIIEEDKAADYRKQKWCERKCSIRKAQRMASTMAKYTGIKKEDLILDVGSGSCTIPPFFHIGPLSNYVGLDISLQALKNSVMNAYLVNGDAEHLPFKDRTFNRVLSFNSLEHVPNPDFFIKENARVCMKGGFVGATVPNAKANVIRDFIRKKRHRDTSFEEAIHQEFEPAQLVKMFEGAGLIDIKLAYRFFIPAEFLEGYLNRHPRMDNILSSRIFGSFEELLEQIPGIKKYAGSVFIFGRVPN